MILFLPSSVIQEQCTSDFFNRVNRYTLCILNIDFFHFKILAHEIHQEFAQWSSVSEQLWKDVIWLLTSTVTVAKSTAVDFFLPNNSEYCIKWIESVPSYAESSHSGVVVAEKGLGSRHIHSPQHQGRAHVDTYIYRQWEHKSNVATNRVAFWETRRDACTAKLSSCLIYMYMFS